MHFPSLHFPSSTLGAVLSFALAAASFLPAPSIAGEIRVSCAGSLSDAVNDAAAEFQRLHPGMTVTPCYGAAIPLLRQIEQGAPADVFVSADPETMDLAVSKGLASEAARRPLATNRLVLAVPADASAVPARVEDLAEPAYRRIAVCNPETTPAGRRTRALLERRGLWDSLRPRFVQAATVRQAVDYAVRGEVEAAFVFKTDTLRTGGAARIASMLEEEHPVVFHASQATTGGNPGEGLLFLDFLSSPRGQSFFKAHGFGLPEWRP